MKKPDSLKEILQHIAICPICGNDYRQNKANLFAQQENVNLAHISCAKSQSNFIAMIIFLGQGVSSVGMVSDLTLSDAERICRLKRITVDELIDFHKLINNDSQEFLNFLTALPPNRLSE